MRHLAGAYTLLVSTALFIMGGAALFAAEPFRQALPGYAFSFPRDHFSHDDYRTEWWYYTGHLSSGGRDYGYELTFFRTGLAENRSNPSRWAAKNLYLAHFAVSDRSRKTFRYFERVGRPGVGQAGADDRQFKVWVGDWQVSGRGDSPRLQAKEGGYGVDFSLRAAKPPVVNGENGISQKGEGGRASHYYSVTRLKTEGTLTIDGSARPVTGTSWMDHEFGSTDLAPDQVGWDWFSLQLDDGTDVMLYLIRRKDGTPDPHSAGTWVGADGTAAHLRGADFSVEILDRWTSPHSGGVYPMKWRLRIPKAQLDAVVTPAFPDQELNTTQSTQVAYWEGASRVQGTVAGRALNGQAYVEMTGYAAPFRKRL